ncbi:uncharacterized protein LOC144820115 [Lissotriton helveticus]
MALPVWKFPANSSRPEMQIQRLESSAPHDYFIKGETSTAVMRSHSKWRTKSSLCGEPYFPKSVFMTEPNLPAMNSALCVRHTRVPANSAVHSRSERFQDLLPNVCSAVWLSAKYPQFTQAELEQKLQRGDIFRGLVSCRSQKPKGDDHDIPETPAEQTHQLGLKNHRKIITPCRPSENFFSHISHIQDQLVSGQSPRRLFARRSDVLPNRTNGKRPSGEARARQENMNVVAKMSSQSREPLLPPILSVWIQKDAMQRAITLQL